MKLRELPDDADISSVKLILPEEVLEAFKDYAGGEPQMYAVGGVNGYGFMMSPDMPQAEERRLYPLPPSVCPVHLLDWDVVA